MSGLYLYCQNPDCGVYLGSLGGNDCPYCGWAAEPEPERADDDEDATKGGSAA